MEYLAVIGLSLLFIMPMIVIFFDQTNSLQEEIDYAHIEKIQTVLIDAAEEIYYIGPPSQKQLDIYFPEHIKSVLVQDQEIQISIESLSTPLIQYTQLPLNLTGSISTHAGIHHVTVTATDTGVTISET